MCDTSDCSKRGVFTAAVRENRELCRDHFLMSLAAPGFPPCAPGNFIQVQCTAPGEDFGERTVEWEDNRPPVLQQAELVEAEPFLRRPFSLAGARHGGETPELDIIYRVVGIGTRRLAGCAAGDEISIIGPLGNSFPVPGDCRTAVLVGGGVGIPPLVYLGRTLAERGISATVLVGVTSAEHLFLSAGSDPADRDGAPSFCCRAFEELGMPTAISTDDGTVGCAGRVPALFERWLARRPVDADSPVVYCCGPEPMMKAVSAVSASGGLTCYVSMERNMACGMGTCQSCTVKIVDTSGEGWSYRLCCRDGPVFEASKILWT